MGKRLLLAFYLCLPLFCFAAAPLPPAPSLILSTSEPLSLLDHPEIQLYRDTFAAASTIAAEPPSPDNIAEFLATLKPVKALDPINGGSYWLYVKVRNDTEQTRWFFETYDGLMDSAYLFVYRSDGMQKLSSGFLHEQHFSLSYGLDFNIAQGQELGLLLNVESRYFSGRPRFEILDEQQYLNWWRTEHSLILACLGGIAVLAFYNLSVGLWARDRSYFYYASYLLATGVAWAAAYNAIADWFDLHSYLLLMPPFFLSFAFNTLYFIHFLELPTQHPRLSKVCYAMVVWCLLMAASVILLPPGIYMAAFYCTIVSWVLLGLFAGIYRLWLGYKPARYFVAGFTVLFIGYMISVLPMFGKDLVIRNHNLVTLLAQMLDMLLLSLALADRINLLRQDKDRAFEKAFDSERVAIEKEQLANEKLQQALALSEQENQRKSDFLRMVSHELRTPLHSILSSAEQWEQVDDETVRQDLVSHITYGAARLRTQVDNLVLLAETDDHKIEASQADFEIQPLIDRLNDIAQSLVHDNVRYTLKLDPDLPKIFRGDAYLLEHMVRTVLENACQYTREGSVEFRVEWDQGDSSLNIHVCDTGCGMTREQEQSMFNDFVQVSRGLNRKSEGLGLGLTICYRLCEVLGADFVMRSDLGQGTSVHLRLPIERVERFGGLAPEDTPLGRVLVVEDNVVNAKVMERVILYLGYDVDIADSGQQALELLKDNHYHVILMDIQMPVMDGITATRWIRQRRIDTPVIAITANSDSRVRKRCFDIGMNDVMVKPVRRSDIRRLLEQHISYRLNKS